MSFFSGYSFFIHLFVFLVPAFILGFFEKKIKWYRAILSCLFIYLIYRDTTIQLLYLIFYVVFSVYLVKIYLFLRDKLGRNKYIYWHAMLFALAPLVLYKIAMLEGHSWFGFLGISYICFRVLQVIIETYDGVIKEINAIQFVSFLIFFPSLSSGPIDRSRRFNADDEKIWNRAEYLEMSSTGLFKLILGLFYKIVCSAYFYTLLQNKFEGKYSPLYLVGYAYVYGMYLFFDFAGYSSMAVGVSYILGIKMPDNFNRPFLSIDIKDFWNRWHITLSTWFRDFVFSRFMIDSARKKRFSNRTFGACVGLILNMGVMGLWHGLCWNYIIYGLYHGFILAFTEIYQKKSNFYKKCKNLKWYKAISWFININIVMFGFLIFSGHLNNIGKIITEHNQVIKSVKAIEEINFKIVEDVNNNFYIFSEIQIPACEEAFLIFDNEKKFFNISDGCLRLLIEKDCFDKLIDTEFSVELKVKRKSFTKKGHIISQRKLTYESSTMGCSISNGKFSFITDRDKNLFNAFVIQIHSLSTNSYMNVYFGKDSQKNNTFICPYETGYYDLLLKANSNLQDEFFSYRVFLEKNKVYIYSVNCEKFTEKEIILNDFRFY